MTIKSSSLTFTKILILIICIAGLNSKEGDLAEGCALPGNIKTKKVQPDPPECPTCLCTTSPCYPATGNYVMSATDLQIPTRGFPLSITRTYDSVRAIDGLFGIGWSSNITMRLTYTTYEAPNNYKEAAIVMPNGRFYRFRLNPDGITFTPQQGSKDTLIRNTDGTFDLTPVLSRSKYHYSTTGLLLTASDEYGNTLSYSYDQDGRVEQVTDATGSGRYLDIVYGADSRISSIQDSSGRQVEYIYNSQGALTGVVDAADRLTTYSYVNGRFGPLLSRITDHWGRVITDVTYDSTGRVNSYTEEGETYTYTYNYGSNPLKTRKTNSAGNAWIFTFDSTGRITQDDSPLNPPLNTSYYPDGKIQLITDSVGVKTLFTYNATGSIASVTKDYQGSGTGSAPIRFDISYDANFPEKVTRILPVSPTTGVRNPDWQEWRYDYYPPGTTAPGALFHVYRVRNDGVTIDTLANYTYNSAGQEITRSDPTGAVVTLDYNLDGDLASITYPLNSDFGQAPVFQYGHDSLGRIVSIIDENGNVAEFTYDPIDRITSIKLPRPSLGSPLEFLSTYTYDNYDSLSQLLFLHVTDPNGNISKIGYDQFEHLVKSIDSLNGTISRTYNKGLLSSFVDQNGNVTSYSYNAERQLVTTTFPQGTTETYTYYYDGLFKSRKDKKNQTIVYTYDRLKRLLKEAFGSNSTVTYTYTGQKLTQVVDTFPNPDETHTFSYDPAYRVSSNTQATRGTVTYTYDTADRIASYAISGGGPTATYGYYPDGSFRTVDWSPVAGQFRYDYRLNGQYATASFPNGQQRNYGYDDQGRLLQIANTHPSVGNLATYDYSYDIDNSTGLPTMLGQRTELKSNVPSQNMIDSIFKYYYDSKYELIRADYPNVAPFSSEIDTWVYDAIGNRISSTMNGTPTTYTYFKNGTNPNNGQRLQSDGSSTYGYDANGNTTSKNGSGGNFTFTWDTFDHITGISGATTATYKYDYLGRRVSKTVGGITTTYVYDGYDLVAERGGTVADYVFGPSIDSPLSMKRGTSVYYYCVDGLGSVSLVNESTGIVQNKYVTDAWGMIRSQTENIVNPFTYTAREAGQANLMFYRARYYNPSTGRFMSEDPIGFRGGINLYTYVKNQPVNFIDPSGLQEIIPIPITPSTPIITNPGLPEPAGGSEIGKAVGVVVKAGTGLAVAPFVIAGALILLFPSDISPDDTMELAKGGDKNILPSWINTDDLKKRGDEKSGKDVAKRILDKRYPEGYPTGPKSDFNQIKKYIDRKNCP